MSFWSGLKVFGKDIVKVFAWAGSPKGKQVIGTGEGIIEAVLPISIPIVSLFNSWFQKAYTVEALAVAANQGTGSGVDKAALAIQTVTPQVLQYAVQEGLAPRTAEQIQKANDAVLAFINAMTKNPA
jgi:hypothetical protein